MSSAIRRPAPLRLWLGALIAAILVIVIPGTLQAKDKRELKVMTQNLYLGSSLAPALNATTPAAFLIGVATIYATVQLTNFPARADAIADHIAAHNPDIISLQEVSNWISVGPGAPPSLDFLAILGQALVDRGLSYSVAAVSNNANIGPIPLLLCSGPFGSCALTFQDRDVFLVTNDNPDLEISNPQSGHYATPQFHVTPVGPVSFNRGWASVDGRLEGKEFHFVTTHLEPEARRAR